MTRLKLGPNFSIEEFDCHDGTRVPRTAEQALRVWVAEIGEPLRREFGPVRVTSGYRTASYNQRVGGAARSYHRYDLHHPASAGGGDRLDVAADVVPARGTPLQWQKWALQRFGSDAWDLGGGRGAAVAYPRSGFVHLDTGPRRTWAG